MELHMFREQNRISPRGELEKKREVNLACSRVDFDHIMKSSKH